MSTKVYLLREYRAQRMRRFRLRQARWSEQITLADTYFSSNQWDLSASAADSALRIALDLVADVRQRHVAPSTPPMQLSIAASKSANAYGKSGKRRAVGGGAVTAMISSVQSKVQRFIIDKSAAAQRDDYTVAHLAQWGRDGLSKQSSSPVE